MNTKNKLQEILATSELSNEEILLIAQQAIALRPKKFEWSYPKDNTYTVYNTSIESGYDGVGIANKHCGTYRKSEQYAKYTHKREVEARVIESLIEQIDGDWLPDWEDGEQVKYEINYDHNVGKYKYINVRKMRTVGGIVASEETVKKVIDMLNNGEVKLDDEGRLVL